MTEEWEDVMGADQKVAIHSGIEIERLKDIGKIISVLPKDGEFHKLIKKIFDQRKKSIEDGKDIDWGTGEALAFASLIQDGYKIRISG